MKPRTFIFQCAYDTVTGIVADGTATVQIWLEHFEECYQAEYQRTITVVDEKGNDVDDLTRYTLDCIEARAIELYEQLEREEREEREEVYSLTIAY